MRSDRVKKGLERGPHRSLMKATGLGDADIRNPFIGIACSHTDAVPGHVHLDAVGEFMKKAIRAAGATPILFHTIAICDGIAMGHRGMKYSLMSRELIADCVESMGEAHAFDALVCIPNCDKIIPGMLMAALRLDIPTVFFSGGPMEAGRHAGRTIDLIDPFQAVARCSRGEITATEARALENRACPTCGSCSGLFTANSMNCLTEAIGMALPGNGTTLATSPERLTLGRLAARRVVTMAKEWIAGGLRPTYPLLPRRIMSRRAFRNAFVLDMAMGGSTNTVLHLLAMAREAGVAFTLDDVQRVSRRTPNICRVAPSATPEGRIHHLEDVHRAGGIHTILDQLRADRPSTLHLDCPTVTGETLGENIAKHSLRSPRLTASARRLIRRGGQATGRTVDSVKAMYRGATPERLPGLDRRRIDPFDVIRPLERAFTPGGGLVILRGNIARDGAVVKLAGVDASMYRHSGPAVVFEGHDEACAGILGGRIRPGDVVVIRNEGPRGGPGMQEMLAPTSYLKGMGLDRDCALITDGRFSGGTAGASVGHVSPEAAAGGEIALLRDGDTIEIDLAAGTLNARLSKAELARRRKAWTPLPVPIRHGALGRYAAHATSAATGAILDWPGKD